jgi:hypothetical protein
MVLNADAGDQQESAAPRDGGGGGRARAPTAGALTAQQKVEASQPMSDKFKLEFLCGWMFLNCFGGIWQCLLQLDTPDKAGVVLLFVLEQLLRVFISIAGFVLFGFSSCWQGFYSPLLGWVQSASAVFWKRWVIH